MNGAMGALSLEEYVYQISTVALPFGDLGNYQKAYTVIIFLNKIHKKQRETYILPYRCIIR